MIKHKSKKRKTKKEQKWSKRSRVGKKTRQRTGNKKSMEVNESNGAKHFSLRSTIQQAKKERQKAGSKLRQGRKQVQAREGDRTLA